MKNSVRILQEVINLIQANEECASFLANVKPSVDIDCLDKQFPRICSFETERQMRGSRFKVSLAEWLQGI